MIRAGDADPDWATRTDAFQLLSGHFRRHLAVAHVAYSVGTEVAQALYTGFLFAWEGHLFWATAAHCIEQMRKIRDEATNFAGPRFYDTTDRKQPGVPLPVFDLVREHVPSDDLDVAVVQITGMWRRLFEANPLFLPFDERAIRNCETAAAPDALCLVGFPERWVQERRADLGTAIGISFQGDYACVPVLTEPAERTEFHPASFWRGTTCLYRQVILPSGSSDRVLDSVSGMSGGQVLSLQDQSDGLRYRLVGIQSEWLAESKILRLEPTRSLVHLLGTLSKWGLLLPEKP